MAVMKNQHMKILQKKNWENKNKSEISKSNDENN